MTDEVKTAVVPDGPDAIWLEPSCCADPQNGRCWSEDSCFQECDGHPQIVPTKYIRADVPATPAFPRPAFITSGPHLSGYLVSLGYPTLATAQDAHEALSLANRDAQGGEPGPIYEQAAAPAPLPGGFSGPFSPEGAKIPTCALADIAAERLRQVQQEGWTPDHDDTHEDGQMADAAGVYAITAGAGWDPNDFAYDKDGKAIAPAKWPWEPHWWKPDGRRRDLVKAGALIVAEIERLDRK